MKFKSLLSKNLRLRATLAVLLFGSSGVFAQIDQSKYEVHSFDGLLNSHSGRATKNNGGISAIKLPLNHGAESNGMVNVSKLRGNKQVLIGELSNNKQNTFYLTIDNGNVSGHSILLDKKKAYQYITENGKTFVQEVDINKLLCVEFEGHAANLVPAQTQTTPASTSVTNLQSFPGATGCVYIDFDGELVTGTRWLGGDTINAAPSGLTDAAIREVWEIAAEDFRPFNINVTTSRAVFDSYPKTRRMMAIVTPTSDAAPGSGGVAYIGSFNWNDDTPCWVYNRSTKACGETVSHEIGHTLDVLHDGRTTPTETYYAGHGEWAPIMGASFYKPVTHWSKGEYLNANNQEDDLALITATKFGLGYRTDDHGNGLSTATTLNVDPLGIVDSASNTGIIEQNTDKDYFAFTTGGGQVDLEFKTVYRHGNLDILAKIYNNSGGVIATANGTSLDATFSGTLAAGSYFISIEGTGEGDVLGDGYSDYSSLGTFSIEGTIPPATSGCTEPVWDASTAYVAGARVQFNDTLYEAKWWTQGENPSEKSGTYDVWKFIQACPVVVQDPYVRFTNIEDGDKFWFLPSHPYNQKVEVQTNHDVVGIDSIKYIIVDSYANYGNVRRITSTTAPFNIEFLPELSFSTDVHAIAFSNGKASPEAKVTINFVEPAAPTIDIVNPMDSSNVYIHPQIGGVTIKSDINTDETVIDSVYYEIAHIYTNHAEVERKMVYSAPFEYGFLPKESSRIEIVAVSFDHWGRSSQFDKVTVYPKVHNPIMTITSPNDGQIFTMDPNNLDSIQVTADAQNEDVSSFAAYLVKAFNGGTGTTIFSGVNQTKPYEFKFKPVASDSIQIIYGSVSNVGPPHWDTNTVFIQGIAPDVLTITTPAQNAVLGHNKGYDFNVDISGITSSAVQSVTYNFVGTGYNQSSTSTVAPFTKEWGFANFGDYYTVAKAATAFGDTVVSDTLRFTVVNSLPTVTLTSPTQDQVYTLGETANFTVDVNDLDGQVVKVEYYIFDGSPYPRIFTVNNAPFDTVYNWGSIGSKRVRAVAYDNDDRAGSTGMIDVTVVEGGCTYPEWDAATAYNGGDTVQYNNIAYRAKWWTQNANPETNSGQWDVWENLGACGFGFKKAIASTSEESKAHVYPNPFNNILTIESEGYNRVELLNALGQVVLTQNINSARVELNVIDLPAGIYTMKFVGNNGQVVKSVVKK